MFCLFVCFWSAKTNDFLVQRRLNIYSIAWSSAHTGVDAVCAQVSQQQMLAPLLRHLALENFCFAVGTFECLCMSVVGTNLKKCGALRYQVLGFKFKLCTPKQSFRQTYPIQETPKYMIRK